MATESAKAGKYEVLVDALDDYDDKGNRKTYGKGDVVGLNAEQAERLSTSTPPAVGKPGALAQAEADRLQASADAAQAAADAQKAKVDDHTAAAKSAAKAT
jgi:hypothetical protein